MMSSGETLTRRALDRRGLHARRPHGRSVERGHVALFANSPMWRGETIGSHGLVPNVLLNFDHLGAR